MQLSRVSNAEADFFRNGLKGSMLCIDPWLICQVTSAQTMATPFLNSLNNLEYKLPTVYVSCVKVIFRMMYIKYTGLISCYGTKL